MKEKLKNLNYKKILIDIGFEILGSFLVAIALYNFALKANFPMTGFSGIAMILYRLFDLPIGLTTIVLNIPVAILCYKMLGRGFFLRSLRCMIISSLMIDYIAVLLPVYEGNRILATVCTGVFGGLGYALIYSRESSTGGSDFIIMACKSKWPHLSLGKIAFLSDILIILVGGIIFKDMDGIIYAMIINYIFAIVVDKIMYGMNSGKLALIVTAKGVEISQLIDQTIQRGSTILSGKGAYKLEDKDVIMCACSHKQMITLERLVKKADPFSFIVMVESNEVLGEGFKLTKEEQQARSNLLQ